MVLTSMRTRVLVVLLAGLGPTALTAQHHWQALKAPTSQPLSVDLQSLTATGNIVSVDVRAPTGGGMYAVQPHEVRCTDLSIRLGPAWTYDADAPRSRSAPSLARPRAASAWTQYGPHSDGQLTASAICSLARKRGLLREHTSSLG
jgi:hypothetical protein